MAEDFREFLAWEKASSDAVDFKCIYVDMAGDLVAGLMLSQLVYWCLLPDKNGASKLRVCRDGCWWVAKHRAEWWDEIRITPKQADRAIKMLVKAGLAVKKDSLFNGKRTTHLRIDRDTFLSSWRAHLPEAKREIPSGDGHVGVDQRAISVPTKGAHQYSSKGNIGTDRRATPMTESKAKPTAETTAEAAAPASVRCSIHRAPMERRTKRGDQWYSHQLPDGTWCKGAPGDHPRDGDDWRDDSEERRRKYATSGVRT